MRVTSEQLMNTIVNVLDHKKAHDIVSLHLEGISPMADYFVICHGNSSTQVQALADEVKKAADSQGVPVRGVEGLQTARWVLIDIGDVIVHIFHREDREYYNIERLWSDAKAVELA